MKSYIARNVLDEGTFTGSLRDCRKYVFFKIDEGDVYTISLIRKNGSERIVGVIMFERNVIYRSLFKRNGGHVYYMDMYGGFRHRYDPDVDRHVSWELVSDHDVMLINSFVVGD